MCGDQAAVSSATRAWRRFLAGAREAAIRQEPHRSKSNVPTALAALPRKSRKHRLDQLGHDRSVVAGPSLATDSSLKDLVLVLIPDHHHQKAVVFGSGTHIICVPRNVDAIPSHPVVDTHLEVLFLTTTNRSPSIFSEVLCYLAGVAPKFNTRIVPCGKDRKGLPCSRGWKLVKPGYPTVHGSAGTEENAPGCDEQRDNRI
jgi:hypothetical protein